MQECILVGCDLHDKTMLLKMARGRRAASKATWSNTPGGWRRMLVELRRRAEGRSIYFAYEASCLGFGLYDFLSDAGVKAFVLAPTRIAKSVRQRRTKCDEKDADHILELLRAHVLAGTALPAVWVPDPQTRDDREIVRAWLDVSKKVTRLKTQVKTLLKRTTTRRPEGLGSGWTQKFRAWLRGLTRSRSVLPAGARVHLGTLLRQLESLEKESKILRREVERLSETPRYAHPARRLMAEVAGVGLITAMVFLTEMGDLGRFENRKQVGAYLGLTPSSDDTGESDRKGHITHQGSPRVRRSLCQSVWAMRRDESCEENVYYDRLVAKNPKKKKIAVVACMRRMAVRMWHVGLEAQQETDVFGECATAAM